jgi:hypothetical protein
MRNRSVRWREPLCLFSPTYELGTSRAKFLFFSHEKNNYLAIEEPWKLNRTAAKLLLGIVEIARDERKIVQDAKTSLGLPVGR